MIESFHYRERGEELSTRDYGRQTAALSPRHHPCGNVAWAVQAGAKPGGPPPRRIVLMTDRECISSGSLTCVPEMSSRAYEMLVQKVRK